MEGLLISMMAPETDDRDKKVHGRSMDGSIQPREVDSSIYVVIPVFNRVALTRNCLKRMERVVWPGNLVIVVVDDGSTDGTDQMLAKEFPEVTVIRGDGTLWWTGAMALAIEELTPRFGDDDYVLCLNNDTLIEPDTLQILVDASRQYNGAMVSPMARETNGAVLETGAQIGWGFRTSVGYSGESHEHKNSNGDIEAEVIFGRATLIPVQLFRKIGNFRPDQFPQYFGDSDFSLRAKRAGVPQILVGRAEVRCVNDENTTGLHIEERGTVNLKSAWQMLTNRRSNYNLYYANKFVWMYAPLGLKVIGVARVNYLCLSRVIKPLILPPHRRRRIKSIVKRLIGHSSDSKSVDGK